MTWVLYFWIGYSGFTVTGFESKALCEKAGEQHDTLFGGYKCTEMQLKEKSSGNRRTKD